MKKPRHQPKPVRLRPSMEVDRLIDIHNETKTAKENTLGLRAKLQVCADEAGVAEMLLECLTKSLDHRAVELEEQLEAKLREIRETQMAPVYAVRDLIAQLKRETESIVKHSQSVFQKLEHCQFEAEEVEFHLRRTSSKLTSAIHQVKQSPMEAISAERTLHGAE